LLAGIATLPFAIGAGVTAPFAARAALRWGTKRVVALGLFNMSLGIFLASFMTQESRYFGLVVISMVMMANGLSLVTSPSTDAIMGTLQRDKAGVGSAINDTGREVGGVLGVAVVGSVFVSLYSPKIAENFDKIPGLTENLSPGLLEIAEDSVGAAYQIAQQTPEALREQVQDAVSNAFLQGFATACIVASVVAMVGAVFALRYLPARPSTQQGLTNPTDLQESL
jgi:sugar phosphate permease